MKNKLNEKLNITVRISCYADRNGRPDDIDSWLMETNSTGSMFTISPYLTYVNDLKIRLKIIVRRNISCCFKAWVALAYFYALRQSTC